MKKQFILLLLLLSGLFYAQNFNFDNSFGQEGKLTIMNNNYFINQITMRNDGKFIFSMTDLLDGKSVLKLLNLDGSTDTTFGEGGIKKYNIDYPIYLKYFSDGKAIGSYRTLTQNDDYNTIIKFNDDYSIDINFNKIISKNISFDIQTDDKIIVEYYVDNSDHYMRRYNTSGTADNSFGNLGIARFFTNGKQIRFTGPFVSKTSDNNIYIVSSSDNAPQNYFINKVDQNGNLTPYQYGLLYVGNFTGTLNVTDLKYHNNSIYVVPNYSNVFTNNGNIIPIIKLDSNLSATNNYSNSGQFNSQYRYQNIFHVNNNPILLKSIYNSVPTYSLTNLNSGEILFEYNFNNYYNGTILSTASFQNNSLNSIYIFNRYDDRIIVSRLNNQTLSIHEFEDKNFKMYPNPVNDVLTFSEKLHKIEIISTEGKIIKNITDSNFINLANLPSGNYILKGVKNNEISVQKKFIKK